MGVFVFFDNEITCFLTFEMNYNPNMTNTPLKYENHLHQQEPRWFAVYTRYKREKLVYRRLADKGIETYLPLQKRFRQYDRRLRSTELPLISCYIFTRITKNEYVPVLETEDVVQFVKFSENLISIPEKEINWLQRLLAEGIEMEVNPSEFTRGQKVEITKGNLTGLKGVLVETGQKNNFLLELSGIGQTLRIHVDASLLNAVAVN